MIGSPGEFFVNLGLIETGGCVAADVGGEGSGGGAGGGKGGGGEAGGEEGQLALLIRNTSLIFEDWIYLHGDQLVMTALV